MTIHYSNLTAPALSNTPPERANPHDGGGVPFVRKAQVTLGAEHVAGDVVILMQLPAVLAPSRVLVWVNDGATAGAADIGLFTRKPGSDSQMFDVLNVNYFATALDLSVNLRAEDVAFQSAEFNTLRMAEPLYQRYYGRDPGLEWWLGLTVTTTFAGSAFTVVEVHGVA